MPFSRESVVVDVNKKRLIGVFQPSDVEGASEPLEDIRRSIKDPIGNLSLDSMVFPGKKVAVAVDDNTRITPTRRILPILLGRIESLGVKSDEITIVVALGTHRPMKDHEMREKLGPETTENYNVINHDWDNPAELKLKGRIPDNVPILINKRFMEADIKIGVGNIVPHFTSGWSGGSKIVLPGLAGEDTVAGMHYYGAKSIPNAIGKDENIPRNLMDAVAREAGLHMIVNTVLTRKREIAGVYSGDFINAHRAGVRLSKKIYGVHIPQRADITVVSSHPADIEFWQAMKGLYSAALATKNGGGILLITPCPEGLSVAHREWGDMLSYSSRELEEMIEQKRVKDVTAASLALCVAKTRESYRVALYSPGISDKQAEQLHFMKFDSPNDGLRCLERELGSNSKKLVLTHGGETFPILGTE